MHTLRKSVSLTIVVAMLFIFTASCSGGGSPSSNRTFNVGSAGSDGASSPGDVDVKKGNYSYTAESVAAFRAIASLDPDKKVRNPDYLAVKFVSKEYLRNTYRTLDFDIMRHIIENRRIQTYYSVNARTWHIDENLKGQYKNGIKQVVILGAGFDSRGYRFKKEMPDVRFFEVDLHQTQKEKIYRVMEIFGSLPSNVVYVPIDFNKEFLKSVLEKAGYTNSLKTYFIWEGVTMYITEEAVRGTLDFIAGNAAAGSTVIFDYVIRELIHGNDEKCPGAIDFMKQLEVRGEPWIFGLDMDAAPQFINKMGLRLLSNIGFDQLAYKYLVRSDGSIDLKLSRCSGMVHAAVP